MKHLCKVDIDKLISAVRITTITSTHLFFVAPSNDVQLASNETREACSARTASSRVTQMLNLRGVVRHLPALQKALIGSKSELLCIICDVRFWNLQIFMLSRRPPQMLSDDRLAKIERLVSKSLNEGASLQKVSPSGGLAKSSQ